MTEREHTVLNIIDKFRIVRALDLAWMAGYSDETYCRKCLRNMVNAGLINVVRDKDGRNCYYLTGKGLREIGKESHVYEVTYTTNHALDVARLGTYLYITQDVGFEAVLTDLDLRKTLGNGKHRPDIVLNNTAYEVELSHKKQQRLIQNISSNGLYDRQVWVVPDQKRFIAKQLHSAAKYTLSKIEILSLDRVYKTVEDADIHQNFMRRSAGIPMDSPPVTINRNISKYLGGSNGQNGS